MSETKVNYSDLLELMQGDFEPTMIEMTLSDLRRLQGQEPNFNLAEFMEATKEIHGKALVILTESSCNLHVDEQGRLLSFV